MTSYIFSFENDVHAWAVDYGLCCLGETVHQVNVDCIFDSKTFSFSSTEGSNSKFMLDNAQISDGDRVWLRRPFSPGYFDKDALHEADREFAYKTSNQFYLGFMDLLQEQTFVVNNIFALTTAESKMQQLHFARSLGILTPDTLITNSISAAKDFTKAGPTVYKSLTNAEWISDGLLYNTRTRLITGELLEAAAPTFHASPTILQRVIESDDEVRVFIAGNTVIAASLSFSNKETGRIDWRSQVDQIKPKRVSLPSELETALVKLNKKLGLICSSMDLIYSNGSYYFLEVNPSGQFLWLDKPDAGLPVLDMFCHFLMSGDANYDYDGDGEITARKFYEEKGEEYDSKTNSGCDWLDYDPDKPAIKYHRSIYLEAEE